jgi:hypothetical protein
VRVLRHQALGEQQVVQVEPEELLVQSSHPGVLMRVAHDVSSLFYYLVIRSERIRPRDVTRARQPMPARLPWIPA